MSFRSYSFRSYSFGLFRSYSLGLIPGPRKSKLVLRSTYQIFEWDRINSDRNFYNVDRYVHRVNGNRSKEMVERNGSNRPPVPWVESSPFRNWVERTWVDLEKCQVQGRQNIDFDPSPFDLIRPQSIRPKLFDQKGRPLSFRPEKFDLFTATHLIPRSPFSLRDIWATLMSPKWAEIFVAQMAGDETSLPLLRSCSILS